jgi:hypothetical protein
MGILEASDTGEGCTMAEEDNDPNRAFEPFLRRHATRPFDDVLNAPIPERVLAAVRRPEGAGAFKRVVARILNWRGQGR